MIDPTPAILLTAGGLTVLAAGVVVGWVARGRADRQELREANERAVDRDRAAYLAATEAQRSEEELTQLRDTGDHKVVPFYDWAEDDNPSLPRSLPDAAWQPAAKSWWRP